VPQQVRDVWSQQFVCCHKLQGVCEELAAVTTEESSSTRKLENRKGTHARHDRTIAGQDASPPHQGQKQGDGVQKSTGHASPYIASISTRPATNCPDARMAATPIAVGSREGETVDDRNLAVGFSSSGTNFGTPNRWVTRTMIYSGSERESMQRIHVTASSRCRSTGTHACSCMCTRQSEAARGST
jgi:hypothetical protein